MHKAKHSNKGMTLVELMVAMSICTLAVAGVISSTILFAKITKAHESMADFQNDIRLGLQELSFDVINASRISNRSDTGFTLNYSDSSTISYRLSGTEIIRTANGSSRTLFNNVSSFDVLSSSSDATGNPTLDYNSNELAIELIQLRNSNSLAPESKVKLENFVYKLRNS